MNSDQLNRWLTLGANLGVIAGIVFLGIEVRQNTQSLEVSAYQQLISQIDAMATLRLQDPELGIALNSAIASYPNDASDEEIYRAMSFFFILTRHADLAYYQYQQGALSEARLNSALAPLRTYWCTDAYDSFWISWGESFVAEFRKFIVAETDEC